MRFQKTLLSTVVGCSLLASGCGVSARTPGDENSGSAKSALTSTNGTGSNGTGSNGTGSNGTGSNGTGSNGTGSNGTGSNGTGSNGTGTDGSTIASVALQGVTLASGAALDASLAGSQLVGTDATGGSLSGADFVGATFKATRLDGQSIQLRVDAFAAGTAPDADINSYTVSFADGSGWSPVCGLDANGAPVAAIALSGTWNYGDGVPGGGSKIDDPTVFTLACDKSTFSKCVKWGYKPWATAQQCSSLTSCQPVSLAPYHQACVRMVHADYCGNGHSYTQNGTTIDLFDGLGVQLDTQANWSLDAEWTPAGARCVSDGKLRILDDEPDCADSIESSTCGSLDDFNTGTLLMDKFVPR